MTPCISDKFKLQVDALQSYLMDIENALKKQECLKPVADEEENLIVEYGKRLSGKFNKVFDQFAKMIAGFDPATMEDAKNYFNKKLQYLILGSPFSNRAYNKPAGYAGDFMLMDMIYRDDKSGTSLFSKCVNYYFTSLNGSNNAAKNRIGYILSKITKLVEINHRLNKTIKILSIGCGPAFEIEQVFRRNLLPEQTEIQIDLIDQDLNALDHIRSRLENIPLNKMCTVKINYINRTVKSLVLKGIGNCGYDLIYSFGLFDYLPDRICREVAKTAFRSLRSGGQVIIGNFNSSSPDKFIMEFGLDWKLIYRSRSELRKLFELISDSFSIENEALEINLFCILDKM